MGGGPQAVQSDLSVGFDYTVKSQDRRVYSIDKEKPLEHLGLCVM